MKNKVMDRNRVAIGDIPFVSSDNQNMLNRISAGSFRELLSSSGASLVPGDLTKQLARPSRAEHLQPQSAKRSLENMCDWEIKIIKRPRAD